MFVVLVSFYMQYYLILQDAYRFISEEDKQKIAAQVENFRTEKSKFDREVAKWDDTGNDVIVLAKQMCMIMMEMTDFTRYKVCGLIIFLINNCQLILLYYFIFTYQFYLILFINLILIFLNCLFIYLSIII